MNHSVVDILFANWTGHEPDGTADGRDHREDAGPDFVRDTCRFVDQPFDSHLRPSVDQISINYMFEIAPNPRGAPADSASMPGAVHTQAKRYSLKEKIVPVTWLCVEN